MLSLYLYIHGDGVGKSGGVVIDFKPTAVHVNGSLGFDVVFALSRGGV